MIKNKGGQVFLMAAVIIAGLVLGATKVVNSAQSSGDQEAFYDRALELKSETNSVLDYGIVTGPAINEQQMQTFLSNYNEYIGSEEVLFIFGDSAGIVNAIRYQNINNFMPVSLATNTGGTPITIPISITTSAMAEVTRNNNLVTVRIRGIDYIFDLKPGQNFYFVLIKDEDGEKFVAAR